MARTKRLAQSLITRMPYSEEYDPETIFLASKHVEARALIAVVIPIHVDNPAGAVLLVSDLLSRGLHLVALVSWARDRHIVVTKSRRLTNKWELLAIFSKSPNYIMTKDTVRQLKRGFEGKENTFDEDQFLTCLGDHWTVKNDRRDRRFLPATIVMNCGQLADLQPGDTVLDPFGNPAIRDVCKLLGWKYWDMGLANPARESKKNIQENP